MFDAYAALENSGVTPVATEAACKIDPYKE